MAVCAALPVRFAGVVLLPGGDRGGLPCAHRHPLAEAAAVTGHPRGAVAAAPHVTRIPGAAHHAALPAAPHAGGGTGPGGAVRHTSRRRPSCRSSWWSTGRAAPAVPRGREVGLVGVVPGLHGRDVVGLELQPGREGVGVARQPAKHRCRCPTCRCRPRSRSRPTCRRRTRSRPRCCRWSWRVSPSHHAGRWACPSAADHAVAAGAGDRHQHGHGEKRDRQGGEESLEARFHVLSIPCLVYQSGEASLNQV